MNFFSSWFAPKSALPTSTTASKRQSDIEKTRQIYDYQRSEVMPSVVTNIDPLPTAELPAPGWLLQAARAAASVQVCLALGKVRLKNLDAIAEKAADAAVEVINQQPTSSSRPTAAAIAAETEQRIEQIVASQSERDFGVKVAEAALAAKLVAQVASAGPKIEEVGDEIGSDIQKVANENDDLASTLHAKVGPNGDPIILDFEGGIDETVELRATRDHRTMLGIAGLEPTERAFYDHFDADEAFARARVAGLNPMAIRIVKEEDMTGSGWMPTDDHLKCTALDDGKQGTEPSYPFSGDTLASACANKRLFMVDYKWLEAAPEAVDKGKYVYIPKALFAVPEDRSIRKEHPLFPVAIWIYRSGTDESTAKLYTPRDKFAWEIAKLIVTVIDGNDHEYFHHLICTHLLLEPFGIAFRRQLHETHPVYRLLYPHFYGTIFINRQALRVLLAEDGPVDRNLLAPIARIGNVLSNKLASVNFNELMFPNHIEARGVGTSKLHYPYRDDAGALWSCVKKWVTDYVHTFYVTDSAVAHDTELQAFAKEVVSEPVNLKGFGDAAYLSGTSSIVISTREYLIKTLTMIIFQGSCQHAALNFAQLPFLAYAIAWPLATLQGELPPTAEEAGNTSLTWREWRQWFPTIQMTEQQWITNTLLGSVNFTRLGEYRGEVTKGFPQLERSLDTFKQDLEEIGRRVEAREKNETVPYTVLNPAKIPASINI